MPPRAPGAGLEAVFHPNAIAVIGASQDPTKIGGRPVQFLGRYGFAGAVYPINPRATEVQGYRAYKSVADLPETPDLTVIAVSAEMAPDAVDACAARGVKAAVVLSSGFSEMGPAGLALQERIGATARRTGMRVVGPNCLGSIGVAERAISTFSIVLEGSMPQTGPLGIISQSGNLGSYTMLLAGERGIGVSQFMTTGNECDVDVADGVAFLARDPATSVILLIMETCRDPARLIAALDAAREAGKPVIVLKIGETEAGQQAAASHTGALAGSEAVFDAVFRRAGAWRGAQPGAIGRSRPGHGGARRPPPARAARDAARRVGRLRCPVGRRGQRRRAYLARTARGDPGAHHRHRALCLTTQSGRRDGADGARGRRSWRRS